MSNLNLSNNDWKLVVILIDLLKPFYVSTNLLQTQQYHTLSTGKIIENALRKYFDYKINDTSCIGIEKLRCAHLKIGWTSFFSIFFEPILYSAIKRVRKCT